MKGLLGVQSDLQDVQAELQEVVMFLLVLSLSDSCSWVTDDVSHICVFQDKHGVEVRKRRRSRFHTLLKTEKMWKTITTRKKCAGKVKRYVL